MRLATCWPAGLAKACAILVAGTMVLSAGTDLAWSRYRDHAYADSFGNLVVRSASGYKRIIVGQGHLARELSSYEGADDGYRGYRDCYRPPHLFKGRDYMYGLPDGVLPQAPCR
jgi:hypothetical protein